MESRSERQMVANNYATTEAVAGMALNFSFANPLADAEPVPQAGSLAQAFRTRLMDKITETRVSIIDPKHAINSSIIENHGHRVWVRRMEQAAAVKNTPSTDAQNYNYLTIFYAYLIAAASIGEIRNLADENYLQQLDKLHADTTAQFEAVLKNKQILHPKEKERVRLVQQALAEGKGKLIDFMHAQLNGDPDSKEKVAKMLDRTKDWAGLERDALSVATIIDIDPKTNNQHSVVILDEPQTELTEEQKRYFTNPEEQPWFQELDPFTQALVLHYRPRILSGRCTIPSQLRAVLPVGKNAYRQSILVKNNDHLQFINSYYHTGTVAHLSHTNDATAQEITNSNLVQQKRNSGTDATLMICLNSKIADSIVGSYQKILGNRYDADDSKIIQLTKDAASDLKGNGVHYAKLCLNGFRRFEFNNYTGIDEIKSILEINLRIIQLKVIKDDELVKKRVKEIHEILANLNKLRLNPTDANLKALDVIHYLTRLATLNNQIILDHRDQLSQARTIAIWFGCASGENRTSASYYHNIVSSLLDFYKDKKITVNKAKRTQLQDAICNSQHLHIMTALGGTPGTEGIRGKSSGSLRSDYPINRLVTKTSDMKSLPAQDANYNQALSDLIAATKEAYRRRELRGLAEQAHHIIQHAKEYSKKAYFDKDKSTYIEAMQSATGILKAPHDTDAFAKLMRATQNINAIDSQKDQPRYSRKTRLIAGISGALLGLAGLALIGISIMGMITTAGISTPLSVYGSILGFSLLVDALVFGIGGVVATTAGAGFLKMSLFSTKVNAGTRFKDFAAKAKQHQPDADRLDKLVRNLALVF